MSAGEQGGSALLRGHLSALLDGAVWSEGEAAAVFDELLAGRAGAAQVGALVAALRVRGVREDELVGFARALRERAHRAAPAVRPVLDTCGTGGDGAHTLNVSTAVALVAAGAGAYVAKHGNRAVSSRCGSADVLAELGVHLEGPVERAARAVERARVGFYFAPAHHAALRHVAAARRELGTHSVFNLLGPLANPAGATRQLLGCFDPQRLELLARVLARLGAERAWVVRGRDGLDELSPEVPSDVVALREDGSVERFAVSPADAGLEPVPVALLRGGDARHNAAALRALLDGAPGPYRAAVLLNTAAALVVYGAARTLREGVELARASLDEGRAAASLDALVRVSHEATEEVP